MMLLAVPEVAVRANEYRDFLANVKEILPTYVIPGPLASSPMRSTNRH